MESGEWIWRRRTGEAGGKGKDASCWVSSMEKAGTGYSVEGKKNEGRETAS